MPDDTNGGAPFPVAVPVAGWLWAGQGVIAWLAAVMIAGVRVADAVFGQLDRLPVLGVAVVGVGVIGLSLLADAGEVVTGRTVGLGRVAARSILVGCVRRGGGLRS